MRPSEPAELPLRSVQTSTGPVQLADAGRGPLLFFVHGYPGRPDDFRWLAPLLLPDHRLVLPAMPGLDLSPRATCPATDIAGRVDLLSELLDEALDASEQDRAVIGGHSMGGGLAAALAARRPERTGGLALFASIGRRVHRGFRRSRPRPVTGLLENGALKRMMQPVMRLAFRAMGFPPGVSTAAMEHSVRCAAGIDFDQLSAAFDGIDAPCLLAWAEDDPLVEPAIGQELSALLPSGPRLPFPEGGHGLIKTRSVELGTALREWLAGLPAG